MNNSSVKIEGLTKIQANVIAMLFEDGEDIINLINEKLESLELEDEKLDYFSVEFDEEDDVVDHIVTSV